MRLCRLAHEGDDIVLALRNRDCGGQDAVDTRTLGVCRADTGVGDYHAPNLTWGKRNVKLRFPMAGPQTATPPPSPAPSSAPSPRAQLIHIEVDRRLGHEWDEWNGRPLPGGGDFSAAPGLFFRFAALTVAAATGALALLLYLIGPRLGTLWPLLPRILWSVLGLFAVLQSLYLSVIAAAFYSGRSLLPERLLERGPYLQLMNYTSLVARAFGKRDWVEHAAIDIYNTLAERRGRRVGKGELLVLIPRCLSKQALDGVLEIAGRYEVPVFVATRGQLARRVIRERRPRAVVAVACERDMMTGLRDVAGKLPVLGLTMQLPNGPCRDAAIDLGQMERWVQGLVVAAPVPEHTKR